jgi:hypothetical protein
VGEGPSAGWRPAPFRQALVCKGEGAVASCATAPSPASVPYDRYGKVTAFVSSVTAPLRARALPTRLAPVFNVML